MKYHTLDLNLGPDKQWEGCPGEMTEIRLLRVEVGPTERLFQTPQLGGGGWGGLTQDKLQVAWQSRAKSCSPKAAQGDTVAPETTGDCILNPF